MAVKPEIVMRPFALFVILIASPIFAVPAPKRIPKAPPMDGTWEVVERHLDGKRDNSATIIRWTIQGESLVISMLGKTGFKALEVPKFRLVSPTNGRANEIDYVLTPADNDLPSSTFRGLFKLDGDKLMICVSGSPEQDRPIDCKPLPDANLYVFKRVKDE